MKPDDLARTLLNHYSESLSPSQQTRERMLREITLRVTAGAAPEIDPVGAEEPLQAAPVARAGLSPLHVTAIAAGLAALIAIGVDWWRAHERASHVQSHTPATEPAREPAEPTLPEPAPITPAHTLEHPVLPAPVEPAQSAKPHDRALQSPARSGQRGRSAALPGPNAAAPLLERSSVQAAPPAVDRLAPSASDRDELAEELRLIRRAYAALQANEPAAALAHIQLHSLRFPQGKLAEARDVARIMALCQSGQTAQGRAEAARFLGRSPSSAYASRIKSLCGERPASNR